VVNSFLESSLNKWAADNISGVDLSFGINQYDKTVDGATSTTTNYSYQVSKTVFDDRFKIVVGGSYSTDASAEDNLSQNLINDISFEYKLNKTGTAYVKLFHHTEYESILEGEITETGAGLVWKRKISSWRDMFRIFRLLRRTKKVPAPTPAPVPEQPADSATITNPIIETKE
jgi:translocation and assembly module TamB